MVVDGAVFGGLRQAAEAALFAPFDEFGAFGGNRVNGEAFAFTHDQTKRSAHQLAPHSHHITNIKNKAANNTSTPTNKPHRNPQPFALPSPLFPCSPPYWARTSLSLLVSVADKQAQPSVRALRRGALIGCASLGPRAARQDPNEGGLSPPQTQGPRPSTPSAGSHDKSRAKPLPMASPTFPSASASHGGLSETEKQPAAPSAYREPGGCPGALYIERPAIRIRAAAEL